MQLTARRDALLEALGKVKSAVPSKASLAVLSNVLLTARDGKLTVTANDLEVALIAVCPATVSRTGAFGASPKVLESFLKQTDSKTVSLQGKTQTKRWMAKEMKHNPETDKWEEVKVERSQKSLTLVVEAGASSISLEGIAAEDFPKLPQPKKVSAPVTIYSFDRALGEVLYAVAQDECRPILAGVCLTPKGGRLEMAAADGFRLAIASTKAKGKLHDQVVIPGRAAKLLKRLLPGTVVAELWSNGDNKALRFHQRNSLMVLCSAINGSYPRYEQLIPKKGRLLRVAADELKRAVDTVRTIKPSQDIVRLQTKGKTLVVSGRDGDEHQITVKVPAAGRIKTAFCGRYLKDLLNAIGKEMTLRMENPRAPGVVKNNGSIHVIMPMNATD